MEARGEGLVVVFWGVVKMIEGVSGSPNDPEDPAVEQARGSRVSLPFGIYRTGTL